MKERIYQLKLDGGLPVDITPPNFEGFRYSFPQELTHKVTERFVYETDRSYQIRTSTEAGQYFVEKIYKPFRDFQQEEIWLLLVNTKNVVLYEVMLYRGSVNECVVRVGELFREAIRYQATAIIMAHNHPSGDPRPSAEDVRITKLIYEASRLLGIELLDHLVIGENRWTSLQGEGLGFPTR